MNRLFLFLLPAILPFWLYGQQSTGLPPASFDPDIARTDQSSVQEWMLDPPDMDRVHADDREKYGDIRFAVPIETAVNPLTQGTWTQLSNGDRIWRIALRIPGALGIAVGFDHLRLPPGATLHHYSVDHLQIFGGYTHAQMRPGGRFLTGVSTGERAIIEYYEPVYARGAGGFLISRVYMVYKKEGLMPPPAAANSTGFGASFPCQININCPLGNAWQDEKRGVIRIRMAFQEGLGYCSGSLVNNTANDGTPYLLTANHCQSGFTPMYDMWTFFFNYESAGCSNPGVEPALQSLMGCVPRAARQATDFLLIEMDDHPLPAFNAYFNGWDRAMVQASGTTTMIHHPLGDIKKITVDNQPMTVYPNTINWGGGDISPANSHLIGVPEQGTFQQGSSGSPVFNQSGSVIGQFHGGSWNAIDSCLATSLYVGRFALSWDQGATPDTRLKEWLDPLNSGVTTWGGLENPFVPMYDLSGQVRTWWDAPVPNLRVIMSGALSDTAWTDASGNYVFADLPPGGSVNIYPVRDSAVTNGVTAFDLVTIRKHILLIEPFTNPYQYIGSDANGSNSVTAFDLVQIRKIILLLDSAFPGLPSWRFIPSLYVFADPANPFANLPLPNAYTVQLTGDASGLNFTALKTGDGNGSANPGY